MTMALLATTAAASWTTAARGQSGGIELPNIPAEETLMPDAPSWRDAFPFQLRAGVITTINGNREPIVPAGDSGPDWTGRLDLRLLGHPMLNGWVGLLTNLRLRTQISADQTYSVGPDSNLDVQELALTTRATDWLDVDVGRINVRNGVATGFNPTDWFKVDSLVTVDSFDTIDRREDRLGTLVVQTVLHDERGVLLTGFRPEIEGHGGDWTSDRELIGLGLDRTNPRSAFYAKLSPSTGSNLSLSVNTLIEPDRLGVGFEASRALSDTVVVFGEWFGQWRDDLAGEARSRGDLSAETAKRLGHVGRSWQNQLAVGATWSLPFSLVANEDVSLTGEYHYNQAGLSTSQERRWFDGGKAGTISPGEFYAVRGIANTRQEPLSRHEFFLRFNWTDIFDEVDFSTIAFVLPQDTSALVESGIDVNVLTDGHVKLSAFVAAGSNDSIYGSQSGDMGARLAFSYAF